MIIQLDACDEFTAGDHCRLREMLHPDKQDVSIRYSLAHAVVSVGKTTLAHSLKTSEVYYILEGAGRMHIDDEVREVGVDDTVYIPPYAVQYIENIGDRNLKFICIVDPAWRIDDEVIHS